MKTLCSAHRTLFRVGLQAETRVNSTAITNVEPSGWHDCQPNRDVWHYGKRQTWMQPQISIRTRGNLYPYIHGAKLITGMIHTDKHANIIQGPERPEHQLHKYEILNSFNNYNKTFINLKKVILG